MGAAALTPVTDLTAFANGYDGRVDGWGCAPSGCLPSNAIDGSLEYPSRWSCVRYLIDGYDSSSDQNEMCELTLHLLEPTNIEEVRVALWKGHQRTRSFNIVVDGVVMGEFTSSGTTESFEAYELTATLASNVVLQAQHKTDDNSWFSLLEVGLGEKCVSFSWCLRYTYLHKGSSIMSGSAVRPKIAESKNGAGILSPTFFTTALLVLRCLEKTLWVRS